MCDEGEYLIPLMEKNLDYCKYLHPPSPKLLKDGLILAMLTLKLLLNNKLGKKLGIHNGFKSHEFLWEAFFHPNCFHP